MRRLIGRILIMMVTLAASAAGAVWYVHGSGSPAQFRTATVRRGDLVTTLSATGTVEPEEVLDIGAQVAGRIDVFGKDRDQRTIDYGSTVEAGTVLARIDDSVYAAEVAQADAQLEQAKAQVDGSVANLGQMQAKLAQAQRDWARAQDLSASGILDQSDYDASLAAFEVAKADVAVGEAAIEQARKGQAEFAAALDRARQDLAHCTIVSPVRGVIIDRRVNIGQTVVASLNAPSLFLIAKDLRRMQVWVPVNEADIGSIHPGQSVRFTVDARPDQTFTGTVNKVRLNAAMTQNVVTYTVEVNADNASGGLLPYLTANALFETGRWDDVLMVPNAALSWEPGPGLPVSDTEGIGDNGAGVTQGDTGIIWTTAGDHLSPIRVGVKASDGVSTIVEARDLKEGMPVIVGEVQPKTEGAAPGSSPFAPQPGRSRATAGGRQP